MALLMYLLQVNQASWLDFNLNQTLERQTQLNTVSAQLLAEKDALLAEHRIDEIATTKLHMQHPSLDSAIWLRVSVPDVIPKVPVRPRIETDPLTWMRHLLRFVGDSL